MCILCTPRRSLDRYIGRHLGRYIDRHSTDVSVDISAKCRPICRSTYRSSVNRYVDRDVSLDISADISVDMSTDTRPISRSICRPRVVVRLSVDMSIDRPPTFRRYFTATCVYLTCRLVTSAAQISLIYSPLLRGFFVYNPVCLSSVLYQHLVILHRPYPLSCQLYFVYLAVFHLSVLLDND